MLKTIYLLVILFPSSENIEPAIPGTYYNTPEDCIGDMLYMSKRNNTNAYECVEAEIYEMNYTIEAKRNASPSTDGKNTAE